MRSEGPPFESQKVLVRSPDITLLLGLLDQDEGRVVRSGHEIEELADLDIFGRGHQRFPDLKAFLHQNFPAVHRPGRFEGSVRALKFDSVGDFIQLEAIGHLYNDAIAPQVGLELYRRGALFGGEEVFSSGCKNSGTYHEETALHYLAK